VPSNENLPDVRSHDFDISRRQLLGSAATGAVVLGANALPAWAQSSQETVDVLLIGGGIMSATLGVILNQLEPAWTIEMIERLDTVAMESSNGWNNAGTGHSALAELNYSPMDSNGNIHIDKAIEINEAFQVTRQFLAHQVDMGVLKAPRTFINSTPHMSFVWGDQNTEFLAKRYEALKASPLFSGMQFSTDHAEIAKWVPLMMDGRDPKQKLAATWSPLGTDVEWGEVTRQYVTYLKSQQTFTLRTSCEVDDIQKNDDGTWSVRYSNRKSGAATTVKAKFVFIGGGGGARLFCRCPAFPKATPMPASRSVARSSSARSRRSSSSIWPRPMARPRPVHRRCRSRIWIPACWMASAPSCLDHSPPSRRSS
jgi:malate dehydrogenase (quinone)